MRLTAYVRVSTGKQAREDKLGKPVQEKAIRAYARDGGHRIVEWRYDDGVSGGNGLDARKGLPLAVHDVRSGHAEGIVMYRLDRLARDLIKQETVLAELRRIGTVHTTSPAEREYLEDDPDDPTRKLIRQVLGAVNEYERNMIRLRLESGRQAKAEQGRYAGYGSPAFGQQSVDHELVTSDREAAVIARMRQLRAEGLSYAAIADQLNAEGLKPKRGGTWHPMTVSRVLGRLEGQVS
jgi:DNA invertase Pin-like site-specific DNA recombinase